MVAVRERLSRTVEGAFALLARVRVERAVHPVGAVLEGRLVLEGPSATARALGGPADREAVVRVSKSIGLPGGLPDLLGVALRVPAGDGLLDVLFATVGRRRLTHLLLAPAAGWCRHPYTTLLPYVVGGRRLLIGLDPEQPGRADGGDPRAVLAAVVEAPVAFTVTEEPVLGERRRVGRLVLERRRPDGPPITFDPILNALPGLRPVRLLSDLREWAYTGSRRGRGAEPASLHRSPEALVAAPRSAG